MGTRAGVLLIKCLAVCFGVFCLTISTYAETAGDEKETPDLHAVTAVLMDGDSGRVLYGKDEDIFRPMASTTKIMTCILALEMGNPGDKVTASANAAGQPKVHMGVRRGEEYYMKDLLYALMLESYNDAAVMIAEHIGGSVEGFAQLMNQKARDLGCKNTCFVTPNGLDALDPSDDSIYRHGTTAKELARIMRYCMELSPGSEEFLEITGTQNYYFTEASGKRSFSCTNHNALLTTMEGAVSGKTGFTGGAGYSYVGAVVSEGRTFIIALLGSGWPPHKTWKWEDAAKLISYGKKYFHYREVFCPQQFARVPVENGIPGQGEHTAATSLDLCLKPEEESLKLLLREDETVTVTCQVPKRLTAPVDAGMPVGSVRYMLDGKVVAEYPVYTTKKVERIDVWWCLKAVLEKLVGKTDRNVVMFDKVHGAGVQ